jgi:Raf kinase inhibitor-like YbhB/YbcL family protein
VTLRTLALSFAAAAVLVACAPAGPQPSAPPGVAISSITVTSRSFSPNGSIPIDQTCDGKDVSPQLTWSAPPPGTQSLALQMYDPDASKSFTHWLVFNIPPDVTQIAEAADVSTVQGTIGVNDFPDTRYGGPCPPKGEQHRYVFQLYALNATLPLHDGASRAAMDAAMAEHVLGMGKLTGTFGR